MSLTLLALLTPLHAAEIGEPGQRWGFGWHLGVGAGISAKVYVHDRIAIAGQAGLWGLVVRRQALVAEVDVWERALGSGRIVATAGLGVARENDGFWRGETHWGMRIAAGAAWRWDGRGFELGTELGVELYNYNIGNLQFGELPTATVVVRWYPGFGG